MSDTLASEKQEDAPAEEAQEAKTEETKDGSEIGIEDLPDEEVMRLASYRGWRPKKHYNGDPEKWQPAKEFLERAENEVPLLRATIRKSEKKIEQLQGQLGGLIRATQAQIERGVKERMEKLQAERDEAIQNADPAAVAKIDKKIKETEESIKPNGHDTTAQQPTGQSQEDLRILNSWAEKNQWFKTDKKLRAYSYGVWEEVDAANPDLDLEEKLKLVAKGVKADFPEKFGNPRRREAAAVESGGAVRQQKGNSYEGLPAEAKAVCDQLVKDGYLTKQQYVKEYFAKESA